eukprot:TRINITY_DN16812_c0_g1_i1.p2 TRINITY_DN16812_c0_g1~~TRINITY_DN16812_c0_g1_i1.p2  ORF type:complete len:494 (+),score=148.75 TRINITY_DN16812_c0_g1_i1:219-1700(+)
MAAPPPAKIRRRALLSPLAPPAADSPGRAGAEAAEAAETRPASLAGAPCGDVSENSALKMAPAASDGYRLAPPTQAELARAQALRSSLADQLAEIRRLGFPEPRVVPAQSLDRLGSLQRARLEWIKMGGRPEQTHVAAASGQLADWNRRDPLSLAALEKCTDVLGTLALTGASVTFAALSRPSLAAGEDPSAGLPPEPLSECPPRVTAALTVFAQMASSTSELTGHRGAYAAGNDRPCFLIPSLAGALDDLRARRSAAVAMPLYALCCNAFVSFGAVPDADMELIRGARAEVFDLEPRLREKETSADACGIGLPRDALERSDAMWEAAERFVASRPRKVLPRFRALVPESLTQANVTPAQAQEQAQPEQGPCEKAEEESSTAALSEAAGERSSFAEGLEGVAAGERGRSDVEIADAEAVFEAEVEAVAEALEAEAEERAEVEVEAEVELSETDAEAAAEAMKEAAVEAETARDLVQAERTRAVVLGHPVAMAC